MTPWSEPLEVDRLADGGADVDFTIPLAELAGLRSLRAGVAGDLQGHAHFAREQGMPVADLAFSVGEVLTEELLLVQPIVPLHEERECASKPAPAGHGAAGGETHRPFANLADLLKR